MFDGTDKWKIPKLKHPLSRALQPFVRRIQYRNIAVDYHHFLLLCQTIKHSPHLAPLIVTLNIASRRGTWDDYDVEQEEIVKRKSSSISAKRSRPSRSSMVSSTTLASRCESSRPSTLSTASSPCEFSNSTLRKTDRPTFSSNLDMCRASSRASLLPSPSVEIQ